MLKIVSTTDRPLSRAELNHVGDCADEWGNHGDLSAWKTEDGRLMVCFQRFDRPPEDAIFLMLDVALATNLAMRLAELSVIIVRDLAEKLGEEPR
jgi:hypothetical protein